MKHNIILMVSLFAFILVSGQTVQAKDYIKILKGIRNANHSIHVAQAALKHPKFKNLIILKQSIDYDKNKRKILIKELLPFFKGNEALSIVEEMEKCEDKELYNELSETLYEKVFNETNQNNKVLKRKLKQFITLKERNIAFVEKENYDPYSIWWEGYDLYRAFDCDNAIPKFEEGIKGIKDIIANPPTPDWQPSFSYIQVRSGYLFIGLSYMYKAVPEYEKARTAFNSCINTFPEEIPVMGIESYTCLGRMLQNEGKFTEAIEYYKKASTTEEPWSEAESYWAESLIALDSENYAEALKKINWIIDNVDPHYAEEEGILEAPLGVEAAHYNRAYILSTEGRIEEAEKDLDKALNYLVYNGTIGPAVVSYIEHYKKLILNLRDEMKISISPNPLYISLGEKATIQATINSANFKDTKFKTENNVLFSVGETITTGNIASAEITSLAVGNGNIVFEVEIDGKIVSKKVEAYIWLISLFDKNDKEMKSIPLCFEKEYLEIGRGMPPKNKDNYLVFITMDSNKMKLFYSKGNNKFSNTTLIEDPSNKNVYKNELGEKVTVIYPIIITKPIEDAKTTFEIECLDGNIKANLKNFGTTKSYYSNIWSGEPGNIVSSIPDGSVFKIRIKREDLPEGIAVCILQYFTDGEGIDTTKFLNFKRETKNLWVSENLTLKQITSKDDAQNITILYKKDPTITLKIGKFEKQIIPAKGAYVGSRWDYRQEWITNISKNIYKMGYAVIEDQAISRAEFFNDIKKCDLFYINAHGLYDSSKEIYWGIASYETEAEYDSDPRNWWIQLKHFEGKDLKYKFVYFDACGSLKDDIFKMIQKFNADVYIGWTFDFYPLHQGNIAEYFFLNCKTMDAHTALEEAKNTYIQDLGGIIDGSYFIDGIRNGLKIFPPADGDYKKIYLDLYKK